MTNEELYHHGILGQKWGVRRYQNPDGTLTPEGRKRLGYHSTSIASYRAKKKNEKVDKSFKEWSENSKKKADAIVKGKIANEKKIAYESDKKNKQIKSEYKEANKAYKKSLKSNTTYRKGSIREEVGRDASRKYLTQAKQVEKQLRLDPGNKKLQKQYADLMSKHDIERAKAAKAQDVGAARSRKIASMKRARTMAVKAAVGTAVIAGGTYAINSYMKANGYNVNVTSDTVSKAAKVGKSILDASKYFY